MDSPEAYRRYAAVQLIQAIKNGSLHASDGVPLTAVLPAVDAIANLALAITHARTSTMMKLPIGHPQRDLLKPLEPDPLPDIPQS